MVVDPMVVHLRCCCWPRAENRENSAAHERSFVISAINAHTRAGDICRCAVIIDAGCRGDMVKESGP